MSKNKKDRFNNAAAYLFRDINKVHLLPQKKIDDVLDTDIVLMMNQMADFAKQEGKDRKPGEKYAAFPSYIPNAFANVSTARYFWKFIKGHVRVRKGRSIETDLTKDQVEGLKRIISDAYTKSCIGFYEKSVQDYARRTLYLTESFARLNPDMYHLTKKLNGLTKSQRRDLILRIYGDPNYNMKFIHRMINEVTIPDAKKLKILRKLYGKERFVKAVGAAMCVEGNNSDCLSMLYEFMTDLKPEKRAPYLLAYAESYKMLNTGSRYFRLYDPKFWDNKKNKKYFKMLVKRDEGYAKAFEGLDHPTTVKKPRTSAPSTGKKISFGKRA